MKRLLITCAALVMAVPAMAQERNRDRDRESRRERSASALPRSVVQEVVELYNAPNTMRADGSLEIVTDREVRGDIAVLNGPLTIAGHVRGRVVAINADVLLKPGARIDDGITVVGGVVEGRNDAYVAGEIRTYREVLYFHRDGDLIVAERAPRDEEDHDDDWWDRKSRRKRTRNVNRLTLVSAKTYNRVEGLPIYFGPYMRHEYGVLALKADVFGVIRTADNLKFDDSRPGADNFGHNVRGELRIGPIGFGGKAYDIIEGVENWQLTDPEVGLASFFLHRDFRDYYNRHGGGLFAALYAGQKADLTFSYSGERWASRAANDPWTLFRNGQEWRANPAMENTLIHLVGASLRIDTRNDKEDPTTGWLINADYERGLREPHDSLTMGGARAVFDAESRAYNRGFLDFRRYNRMGPGAQLNFRVVAGGWVGQDALPLQRRLSVPGGAGSMPGFDFRRPAGDLDLGTCNVSARPDLPANCDRIALGQVEYRGNLHIDLFGWDPDDWGMDVDNDPEWVLFADAGRGWLVGEPDGKLRYKTSEMPSFASFRTDAGIGLEFDGFGIFVAKALSPATEPPNFFVRLRHRF